MIGGGSLSGGEGTVLGTLIGCLIMAVLANGCVHANISDSSRDVFIGIIIIAAVTLDRLRRRGMPEPEELAEPARAAFHCQGHNEVPEFRPKCIADRAGKVQLTLLRHTTTMPELTASYVRIKLIKIALRAWTRIAENVSYRGRWRSCSFYALTHAEFPDSKPETH